VESEYIVPKSTTNNQLLILTLGLPQSGKSTWALQSAHPIVNRDAIRKTIGGSIRYFKEEKRVNEIEEMMTDSLFNAGHHTVVIDATHLKKKYRDRWIKFGEERGLRIYIYKFLTSLEVCQARARRNFPDETNFPNIIRQMWEKAELDVVIPEKQIKYGDNNP
jgi:predicted kinase